MVLPGFLRHQGHHIEEQGALALAGDFEGALGIAAGGLQIQGVIMPGCVDARHVTAGQHVTLTVQHLDRELAVERFSPRGHAKPVALAPDQIHSPIPLVLQCKRTVHRHTERLAVERIQRLRLSMHVRFTDRSLTMATEAGKRPVLRRVRILERPVAHQFRIETAVRRQIDILEEQPPQGRGNVMAGLGNIDRNLGVLGTDEYRLHQNNHYNEQPCSHR